VGRASASRAWVIDRTLSASLYVGMTTVVFIGAPADKGKGEPRYVRNPGMAEQ